MEFSNQYLTYAEYQELGGNLAEMPFNLLEFKARAKIDNLTFGRLKDLETQIQEVKLCINSLIAEMMTFDNDYDMSSENKGNVQSESVGSYSVTYSTLSNDQKISLNREQEAKYETIIKTYLGNCKLADGTPYLYRGV